MKFWLQEVKTYSFLKKKTSFLSVEISAVTKSSHPSTWCSLNSFFAVQSFNISYTLFFSFSVIVLPVSGKQARRRRSPLYSTQQIPSLPRQNCLFLSRFLTTAPWTSQRRRSLTSLRRWWWALYLFVWCLSYTGVICSTKQKFYYSWHRIINNEHSFMKS